RPEIIHLLRQLAERADVRDDDVRGRQPQLARGLGGDPRLGSPSAHRPAGHQSRQLRLAIDIHPPAEIEVGLLAGLDQQRNHVDDHRSVRKRSLPFGGSAPYLRMDDLLKIAARLRVGEYDPGQSATIESLVPQYALAETVDNGGKSGRPRLDHLTC